MQLRPYQQEVKTKIYNAFRNGKQSVLLQLPTGAGKTILFSSIIKDGFDYGRRTMVLAHRGELIQQAFDKLFKGYGISAGIIKAGSPSTPFNPVQIASVQTMVNRSLAKPVDLVIIDESHHMQNGNTYGKIKDYVTKLNPNCKFLGVTATPCRTNGDGFKNVFEELVQGISITDLVKQGFLSPPRYFVAPLDLGKVKISAGDYNLKELSEAYQTKVHAEDLVYNWKKLANGLKTIGFAVDIEHSKTIVQAFRAEGIPAVHVDGTTKDHIRDQAIKDFTSGHIKVLYNVGVFDEGFDLPSIEAVQLARPTKSLIKYMQMVGRALLPAEGKKYAVVLDHGGLIAEHDIVERERNWTLEGVEKKESNKQIMFKDIETGRTYRPDKLPFDIPMERIQLVELTLPNDYFKKAKENKLEGTFNKLSRIAESKNLSKKWIWYRLIGDLKPGSMEQAKAQITELANFYIMKLGYKQGYAQFLVEDFLKKY